MVYNSDSDLHFEQTAGQSVPNEWLHSFVRCIKYHCGDQIKSALYTLS